MNLTKRFLCNDFTIEVRLLCTWTESRLTINTNNSDRFLIPRNAAAKLWRPKIVVVGCKSCNGPYIKSAEDSYVLIPNTKYILLFVKKQSVITCRFELSSYPFDVQFCSVKFACAKVFDCDNVPISYNVDETVVMSRVNMPPGYTFENVWISPCGATMFAPGTPCTAFNLKLKRIRTRPILWIFTPSIFLVIISWISFWLDEQAAAPRVAIGLTVLLSLSTLFNAIQRDLPAVSTITAADIWMLCCIFIVFASLLEFAIVHFCTQFRFAKKIPPVMMQRMRKTELRVDTVTLSMKLDIISRAVFPIIFIFFNAGFWYYYCT